MGVMVAKTYRYICMICDRELGPEEVTVVFERRGGRLRRRVEHRHVHDAVVEVVWDGEKLVMRPISVLAKAVIESIYG